MPLTLSPVMAVRPNGHSFQHDPVVTRVVRCVSSSTNSVYSSGQPITVNIVSENTLTADELVNVHTDTHYFLMSLVPFNRNTSFVFEFNKEKNINGFMKRCFASVF